jgi:hypothetical protein
MAMAVDLDALVLEPATDVFSIEVTYSPLISAPGVPDFVTRGVFSSNFLDVEMLDSAIFSDQETSLGVRLREFPAEPQEGDKVTITEATHWAFGKAFWVGTCKEDGQGGGLLLLRKQFP